MWKFFLQHWGDIASVGGLIVSIVGFVITIVTVRSAKKAVAGLRDAISRMDTIGDLADAMRVMEEIKSHHIAGAWAILPARYSSAALKLGNVRDGYDKFSNGEEEIIQRIIIHLWDMEQQVYARISARSAQPTSLGSVRRREAEQHNIRRLGYS